MPFNEFRTLKRKEPEGEGAKRGTERGKKGGERDRARLKKQVESLESFVFSSSDFWLVFRSPRTTFELVTPILQSSF